MLEFVRIYGTDNITKTLFDVYNSDRDFVVNGHKAGVPDETTCVKDSLKNISGDSEFYEVRWRKVLSGFFIINKSDKVNDVIEGFHILPEFREWRFLNVFWNFIKGVFNEKPLLIGIYSKNEKAVTHLKKNGFKELTEIVNEGKFHKILVHYF